MNYVARSSRHPEKKKKREILGVRSSKKSSRPRGTLDYVFLRREFVRREKPTSFHG